MSNSLKLLFCCLESIFSVFEEALYRLKACAFKRAEKKIELRCLAVKLFLEKEVCNFEWHLVLSLKYTKSFGVKNLALCGRIFPIKSLSICLNSD